MTAETFERWRTEGRGTGEGANYSPWFTVQDVASTGYVSRVLGWKTQRQHHLLSNIETNYFFILDWAPTVVDIREQFPLPLNATERLAEVLGFTHPRVPRSSGSWIMTTDFLITVVESGQQKLWARAIKPSSELTEPRVIEKLEIERAYWASQNVDWGVVTEKEIDPVFVANIKYIHGSKRPESVVVPSHMFAAAEALILEFMSENISLAEAAAAVDDRLGFRPGESLQLVRHFLANRRWKVDMSKRIDPSQKLDLTSHRAMKIYDTVRQHAA